MKNMMIVSNNYNFKECIKKHLNKLNICINYIDDSNCDDEEIFYLILDECSMINEKNFSCKYCFVNMDKKIHSNINVFGNIITFGLGNKNTITVSSIQDNNEGFMYCIQRSLNNNFNIEIHPEEIPVHAPINNDYEMYSYIIIITIGLIEGMQGVNILRKLFE